MGGHIVGVHTIMTVVCSLFISQRIAIRGIMRESMTNMIMRNRSRLIWLKRVITQKKKNYRHQLLSLPKIAMMNEDVITGDNPMHMLHIIS